jgi:hypothetical protein
VYYTKEWVQKNVLRMSDDEIQKLGSEIEIDSADQMDQAVAANKSQPEMMPDDSSENVRQNAKKSAPFSESFDDGVVALTEDDKKLIENMSQVLESIEADEFIDISKIDLSDIDIDDKINSIKRGLKK